MNALKTLIVALTALTASTAFAAKKPSCGAAAHSYAAMLMARTANKAKTPAQKADWKKAKAGLEKGIKAQCVADHGESQHAAAVACYGQDKLMALRSCPKEPINTWVKQAITEMKAKK